MKTYQKIIVLVVLLVLAILVYISKNNKTEILQDESKKVSTQISTSTDTTISDTNEFYDILATYPKEIRDKTSIMEKYILSTVNRKKEEWKIDGPLYKEERNISIQYPDRSITKYELNIQYDKYNSIEKDTVSYVVKSYEFTGGAHGNVGISTYVYDKNGLIDIRDILNINNENRNDLISMLKNKLKINLNELYNEEMLNSGLSINNYNFENFVVLDGGIKFIFEQYQVAPYAAGFPEVLLSWEEPASFLK